MEEKKDSDMIDVIHVGTQDEKGTGVKKQFSRYMVEQTSIMKTGGYQIFEKPEKPNEEKLKNAKNGN